MADKLRDLTPVDVAYAPGERPTDEKLEGAEVQTKTALEYLEDTIGDAFGESLSTDLVWMSNISRDIGDRSALNPVLKPSIQLLSYVQSLTSGLLEHELDLIPVGVGAAIVSSSSDSSVVPGQYKSTVAELIVPGDWTILAGLLEAAVVKNSRKLITHSPSSGGTITLSTVTSGRGSAYEGARNNTAPSIGQAENGGPFVTVLLSDAINNIYTIQLPAENTVKDFLYDNTNASLSNTASSIGTSQQLRLPTWMFDSAGLDMGTDAGGGGPKVFPLNSIRVYDWLTKKVLDGLLEVKASSTAGNREWEITCTFRSDIILDTGAGQYIVVTNGTSISEAIGALQRDVYFHNHAGDDMIRGISHSDLYDLRTAGALALDRSDYYGPSSIDNNDHSMYLHRDGYTALDLGAGGNVMRGDIVVGNTDTGLSASHENFNRIADSFSIAFGEITNGGKIYFDKVRDQNLAEGRGNIPQNFADTALIIEGALDDGSSLVKTVYIDDTLRVGKDVVLGTDATHDVYVSGDLYVKNSMTLIPRTIGGLTPETGMSIYNSTEKGYTFWNGSAWVNGASTGYAAVVGDGTISFGKFNGTDTATIQAAIDDTEAQGGGRIKILRGNYSYGAVTAEVGSKVVIEGEGESTSIISTDKAFKFELGSSNSGLLDLKISATNTCIEIDGSGHKLEGLILEDATTGIDLVAASTETKIGDKIKYSSIITKILNQSTSVKNIKASIKPSVYANSFYLIDQVDKASVLDKWKRISGTGTIAYVDDADSKVGRGRFTITGTGLFVFEDYMPAMPDAGVGGYLNIKTDTTGTASIGFQSYDANLSLLTSNGGFVTNVHALTTPYEYLQNICVTESASGAQNFPIGTRFIKASIDVTANGGVISFDGFNIFPMNFSTISLYS